MAGKKKAMVTKVSVPFVDGPRSGDSITVDAPPPPRLKLGMPEWTVYEFADDAYHVKLVGDMAKVWRDPDRTQWVVG